MLFFRQREDFQNSNCTQRKHILRFFKNSILMLDLKARIRGKMPKNCDISMIYIARNIEMVMENSKNI